MSVCIGIWVQRMSNLGRCWVQFQVGEECCLRSGFGGYVIWDEGGVLRDYSYENWFSGSERSDPLRASLGKQAKLVLACLDGRPSAGVRIWGA